MLRLINICLASVVLAMLLQLQGCATAPKEADRQDYLDRARSTRTWFEGNVTGLRQQINDSAGYIIFPDVAQWGIILTGGTFGRGLLCRPDGTPTGWAAINIGSIGLQAGVQGFRMMMVLENEVVVNQFKEGKWTGSVGGVAVAVDSGGSSAASFTNGVACYQGANSGLMAGVNIGLNRIRYQSMEEGDF